MSLGFTGRRHSEETKEKLRAARARQFPPFLGKGEAHRGKKLPNDVKKKISETMMGNTNAHHRGDRQSFYNGIRMDSRWEVATAAYLDSKQVIWIYGERGFRLSDGRFYYPDFFVYEDGLFSYLIEVKGYFRTANRIKFEAFKAEYPDIRVELWDKNELMSRGVLREPFLSSVCKTDD